MGEVAAHTKVSLQPLRCANFRKLYWKRLAPLCVPCWEVKMSQLASQQLFSAGLSVGKGPSYVAQCSVLLSESGSHMFSSRSQFTQSHLLGMERFQVISSGFTTWTPSFDVSKGDPNPPKEGQESHTFLEILRGMVKSFQTCHLNHSFPLWWTATRTTPGGLVVNLPIHRGPRRNGSGCHDVPVERLLKSNACN